jgi:phenylalanyl-tRNA synthetase beta chain
MKYLLSWLLECLDEYEYKSISEEAKKVKKIISTHVSEIDSVNEINIDINKIYLVKAKKIEDRKGVVFYCEKSIDIILQLREDFEVDAFYAVIESDSGFRWLNMSDLGGEKEYLIPSLNIDEDNIETWKSGLVKKDYVMLIDNVSIGHRIDLWGHIGMARELCYHLKVKLKSDRELYKNLKLVDADKNFGLSIEDNVAPFFGCIPNVGLLERPSNLLHAYRLSALDTRSHSGLVDLTNYIMFEVGHSTHVFDADVVGSALTIRNAKIDELFTLRDGVSIKLSDADVIVANSNAVLSLAGIAGGKLGCIDKNTKKVHIEAACFHNDFVRISSKRHGLRTESSARFERRSIIKSAIKALERFSKLALDLNDIKIIFKGNIPDSVKIKVCHEKLTKMIGVKVLPDEVIAYSQPLGFNVVFDGGYYFVDVPYWRPDISIEEDFVEEIARSIGYGNITPQKIIIEPSGSVSDDIKSKARDVCYKILRSSEVYTHGIEQEETLSLFKIGDLSLVNLKNQYNEFQRRLRPSLIPSLCMVLKKQIESGKVVDSIFEISQAWTIDSNGDFNEDNKLCVIFYDQNEKKDFYSKKSKLCEFFNFMGVNGSITWESSIGSQTFPFYSKFSSVFKINDSVVGHAGFIEDEVALGVCKRGSIFAFEINILALRSYESENLYKDRKSIDISFMISTKDSVNKISESVANSNSEIVSVNVIDWHKKQDWNNFISVTIRVFFASTINVDSILLSCKDCLEGSGCKLR